MHVTGIHSVAESRAPQAPPPRRVSADDVAHASARAELLHRAIHDDALGRSSAARAALRLLTHRHNGTGAVFPRQDTVAAAIGASRATVIRAVAVLEAAGIAGRQRRRLANGRRTSNSYDVAGRRSAVVDRLVADGLVSGPVRTLAALIGRLSRRTGLARATAAQLAADTGRSHRAVERDLARLGAAHYVGNRGRGRWAVAGLPSPAGSLANPPVLRHGCPPVLPHELQDRLNYRPPLTPPLTRQGTGRLYDGVGQGNRTGRLYNALRRVVDAGLLATTPDMTAADLRRASRRAVRPLRPLLAAAVASGRPADAALVADLQAARPLVDAGMDAVEALGRVVEARQAAEAPAPAAGPLDWYAGRHVRIPRRQAIDVSRALGDIVPGATLHVLAAAADAALADPAGAHWRRPADDRLGLALAWIDAAARELVGEAAAGVGLDAGAVGMGAVPPCAVPRPASMALGGPARDAAVEAIAERLEVDVGLIGLPARRPDAVTVRRGSQAVAVTLAGRPVTGADVEAARGNADAVDAELVAAAAMLAERHAERLGRAAALARALALLEARGWERRPTGPLLALAPPRRRTALLDAGPAADPDGFRAALGRGRLPDLVGNWSWLPPDAAATVGAALTLGAGDADARTVADVAARALAAAGDLASDAWQRDPAERVAAVTAAARTALDLQRQLAGFLAAQRDREAASAARSAARRRQIRERADAARRRHHEARP